MTEQSWQSLEARRGNVLMGRFSVWLLRCYWWLQGCCYLRLIINISVRLNIIYNEWMCVCVSLRQSALLQNMYTVFMSGLFQAQFWWPLMANLRCWPITSSLDCLPSRGLGPTESKMEEAVIAFFYLTSLVDCCPKEQWFVDSYMVQIHLLNKLSKLGVTLPTELS